MLHREFRTNLGPVRQCFREREREMREEGEERFRSEEI